MTAQRQHCPITEVVIQRDEDSIIRYHPSEDFGIVSARLAHILGAHDIVAFSPKQTSEVGTKHLIEVEPHGLLTRARE